MFLKIRRMGIDIIWFERLVMVREIKRNELVKTLAIPGTRQLSVDNSNVSLFHCHKKFCTPCKKEKTQ